MKIELRYLDDKSIFINGNSRECDIHIITDKEKFEFQKRSPGNTA